jgi:asparagine synthetase A
MTTVKKFLLGFRWGNGHDYSEHQVHHLLALLHNQLVLTIGHGIDNERIKVFFVTVEDEGLFRHGEIVFRRN